MDWIQLVLPTEGMQAAILAYRDSFTKDDDLPQIEWDRIEEDYFGWLDQQKDQMLGLNGKTEMVYFAVDPEDRIPAPSICCVGAIVLVIPPFTGICSSSLFPLSGI